MKKEIAIVAFNARYSHTAFGARCLLANLGALQGRADLLEFDIKVNPRVAVEKILAGGYEIAAFGCYIWNIDLVTRVAAILRVVRPSVKIIAGGPEISYEIEVQEIFGYADYVIRGEGEFEFGNLCRRLLSGAPVKEKVIHAGELDPAAMVLPYDLYSDEDLRHRAVYVESSRGCPFHCEYCMSSLDNRVRYFPEERLLQAFERLLERGARTFRFIDRTFNLDTARAVRILDFFRERLVDGLFLHFEVVPDRIPDDLFDAVRRFPSGTLQFEVGIQTFNSEVAARIGRPMDFAAIERNMRRLRQESGVHIHADLIAGLPGESYASFAAGFDRLAELDPHEIQLGILKRLRGAPIARHTERWKMVYSPYAPYEILSTGMIDFATMQRLARFARYWDLTVNSGRFPQAAPLIWMGAASCFDAFMRWSDWLYSAAGTTGGIGFVRLCEFLVHFLVQEKGLDRSRVTGAVLADYQKTNSVSVPAFLRKCDNSKGQGTARGAALSGNSRQLRHLNSES